MRRSESALGYISSSSGVSRKVDIGLTVTMLACLMLAVSISIAGCAEGTGSTVSPKGAGEGCRRVDVEFRRVWAELELAKGGGPYLVLDLGRRKIDLRLKGVLVWSCPVRYEDPDSEVLLEMEPYLRGERNPPVELLTGKHLYAYREQFPDSVLAVVARVAHVKPEQLQRYEPGHFELRFGRRLVIDVHTDVEARSGSWLRNAFAAMRNAVLAPITGAEIKIGMEPEDALTLYRMAHPHLPLLICATAEERG
ncbi:MAG: hypothetical protein ABIJ00_04350 [Candidatus Eisenbacteria bacterium]